MRKIPASARPSSDFERRLMTYAATVGAVLAASGQEAAASTITRVVNLSIPLNGGTVPLDVDNNSVDDFVFANTSIGGFGYFYGTGTVLPTNGFFGLASSKGPYPAGVGLPGPWGSGQWGPAGLDIGKGSPGGPSFLVNFADLGQANSSKGGLLVNLAGLPTDYYALPLRFDIAGATHYGFARVRAEFVAPGELSADILDVAWEDVADTNIHLTGPSLAPVPEPGTLGLLALGAAGLALVRRKARPSQPE